MSKSCIFSRFGIKLLPKCDTSKYALDIERLDRSFEELQTTVAETIAAADSILSLLKSKVILPKNTVIAEWSPETEEYEIIDWNAEVDDIFGYNHNSGALAITHNLLPVVFKQKKERHKFRKVGATTQ